MQKPPPSLLPSSRHLPGTTLAARHDYAIAWGRRLRSQCPSHGPTVVEWAQSSEPNNHQPKCPHHVNCPSVGLDSLYVAFCIRASCQRRPSPWHCPKLLLPATPKMPRHHLALTAAPSLATAQPSQGRASAHT
jgi:hypothetical protein